MGVRKLPQGQCRYTGEVFESLYHAYGNDVLRTAYYYLGEKQKAEDVCQEVFIRLLTYGGDIAEGKERAWLLKVTINCCRDLWRSSWVRRVVLGAPQMELIADPSDPIARREESEMLSKAIGNLAPQFRETVLLYYYDNLTIQEIAEVLNISAGTVASRLARGRSKLEAALKEEEAGA